MKFRLNLHHVLIFAFVSGSLCAVPVFTKAEGETLSFGCFFNSLQHHKFFTKKELNNESVLVETSGVTAQSGRHSIEYDSDINLFFVRISQLHTSDSGRYRCGLGNSSSSKSHREFEVRVADAMCDGNVTLGSPGITVCTETEGGSIRIRCSLSLAALFDLFFCKDGCTKQDVLIKTSRFRAQRGRYRIEYGANGVFYVTIANLTKSDSGLFRCGVDVPSSPNPCQAVEIRVTDGLTTSEPNSTLLPFTLSGSTQKPTTQSFSSSSGSCMPSTAFPPITTLSAATAPSLPERYQSEETRAAGFTFPVVICLSVFAVLLVVLLLVLYKRQRGRVSYRPNTTESSSGENIECATY